MRSGTVKTAVGGEKNNAFSEIKMLFLYNIARKDTNKTVHLRVLGFKSEGVQVKL